MKIESITIGQKNFITLQESSQGFHANQRETIDEIKQNGGDIIQVYSDFHEGDSIPEYMKRINRIIKETGYKSTVGVRQMKQDGKEWIEISGRFIK